MLFDYVMNAARIATIVTILSSVFCFMLAGSVALVVGAFTNGPRLHPRSALYAVLGAVLMASIIWVTVFTAVH